MTKPMAPKDVRHEWTPAPPTHPRYTGRDPVYICPACDGWTANYRLYALGVCPAKDRRAPLNKKQGRRYDDR